MTPFGWIAKVIIGLMGSIYGLSASVVSGVLNLLLVGKLIIRQPGGVAGTDDLTLQHDGSDARIRTLSGGFVYGNNSTSWAGVSSGVDVNTTSANMSPNGFWTNEQYLSSVAGNSVDVGLKRAAAGTWKVTNGTTGAGYLQADRLSVINNAEGGTARLNIQTARDSVTLTGATKDTTTISAPAGCLLLGASFTVDTAVVDDAGDNTWSAAFVTGSTTALATAAAAAQNTKVNKLVVPELASATTQIRFTPNGGSFTAGVIEVVAYYIDLTSLAN